MRVWVIQVGEPLPFVGFDSTERKWRTGRLVEALEESGHEVVWWASRFDHFKKLRRKGPRCVRLTDRVSVELLWSPGYERNLSLRRVLDHRVLGLDFWRKAPRRSQPDVIVCSLPTLELCHAAVNYGRTHDVPVVVDVRDQWPDVFLDHLPTPLRGVGRIALSHDFHMARTSLRGATAITSSSEKFLAWALEHAHRQEQSMDRVFPFGYESTNEPSHRPAQLEHVGRETMIALFVGTFGRSCDLETVIEAARVLMADDRGDVLLVLAGEGAQGPVLRRLAAGLRNVVFTGWLDAQAIRAWLDHAHVGLATYRPDASMSLPNKIFEYMSGGLAIVNSLTGETSRLVTEENIGRGYEPGSAHSLAQTLSTLADDRKGTHEMGQRARRLLETRFDTRKVYAEMVRYLEAMAQLRVAH